MSAPEHLPLAVQDWVFLNTDDRVCLRLENGALNHGTVDQITHDASIFWVWLDNGLGRLALHEEDNITVWFEEERPELAADHLPPPPSDIPPNKQQI